MPVAARLTDLETLMWRLEQLAPRYRSTMMLVLTVDQAPDPRRLADRLDSVMGSVPRLGQRIHPDPLPAWAPRWEPDPGFDLANHLRQYTAAEASDLMRVAEVLSGEPFNPEHPPWRVVVVGGHGIVLQLHHSYTDGLGAIRLAGALFDAERHPAGNAAPLPSLPPGSAESNPRPRMSEWLGRTLLRAVTDPQALQEEARALLSAATGDLRRLGRPTSHLLAARSDGTRLASVDLSLPVFRHTARRAGGTVNDVFLAGLLGGLARYHDKHGPVPSTVRVGIPVSTRADDSALMSNQLQAIAIRGPLRMSDTDERIRLVHEMVRHARSQPYLELLERAAVIGARMPGAAEVAARFASAIDLVASNLPGPPLTLYLAGSRIDRMVPIGPRGGAAVNATLISYCNEISVGVHADPAAVTDFEVLVDCLTAGFDELT